MVRFSLRLPNDLYVALVAQAHAEHRSTNAQIMTILEAATAGMWVSEDHPHRLAELEDDGNARP